MENSEQKTVLSRIENVQSINTSTTAITVAYDNDKVTFKEYAGTNEANVELRSKETMLKLRNSIIAARNAQNTTDEELRNSELEKNLQEVFHTMEILDIQ